MAEAYRDFCQKQHRLIAHYLAVQAWHKGLDCIVVGRTQLETLFGLERFKSERVQWLLEDMKPWFPHLRALYNAKASSSIHSLWLSRSTLIGLLDGEMTTEKRIASIDEDRLRVEALTGHIPTLRGIVSYLGILADGLGVPQEMYTIVLSVKKK